MCVEDAPVKFMIFLIRRDKIVLYGFLRVAQVADKYITYSRYGVPEKCIISVGILQAPKFSIQLTQKKKIVDLPDVGLLFHFCNNFVII